MIVLDPLLTVVNLFEGFRTAFALCPRSVYVSEGGFNDEIKKLVSFWKEMANEGGGKSSMAIKFQTYVSLLTFLHKLYWLNFILGSSNSCPCRLPQNLGGKVYSNRVSGPDHHRLPLLLLSFLSFSRIPCQPLLLLIDPNSFEDELTAMRRNPSTFEV